MEYEYIKDYAASTDGLLTISLLDKCEVIASRIDFQGKFALDNFPSRVSSKLLHVLG